MALINQWLTLLDLPGALWLLSGLSVASGLTFFWGSPASVRLRVALSLSASMLVFTCAPLLVAPLYQSHGTWTWALAALSSTSLFFLAGLTASRAIAGCVSATPLQVLLAALTLIPAGVAAVVSGAAGWGLWALATEVVAALWLMMLKQVSPSLHGSVPRTVGTIVGMTAVLLTGVVWIGLAGVATLSILAGAAGLLRHRNSGALVTLGTASVSLVPALLVPAALLLSFTSAQPYEPLPLYL